MNVTLFEEIYLKRVETIVQAEEINLFVANALRFVLQNVFSNLTNSLTVTISSGDGPVEYWFHDIMNKLFSTCGLMALQVVVLNKQLKQVELPGKRHGNMIMIDSFKSLEKTKISEYNGVYDSFEYYFIFLQTTDDRLQLEINKILQYCFDNFWLHCNVMIQNAKSEIYVYSYIPFQAEQCFQTSPILINQFVDNRFVNTVMFPDKLKNLHLCPLKLDTWEVPPFVINKPNYKLPKLQINGYEIMLMNALSRKMNFTLDAELSEEKKIKINNQIIGCLKDDHETDVSVGYLRHITGNLCATPSAVTYNLPLYVIVLRQEDKDESISMLLFPFDKFTWFLLVICCGIFAIINGFQRNIYKVNIFQTFEVLIGMSTSKEPKGIPRRTRFTIWILSTFILRSVYQSLLFFLFRTHYYRIPPITFDGFNEASFKVVCTEFSSVFIPQILKDELPLIILNGSSELEPLRYLERHPEANLMVITVMDLVAYYVATEMDDRNAFLNLPINDYDQQLVLYFPKHSYLNHRINEYISWLHEAGLLESWREWTNYDFKVTKQDGNAGHYDDEVELMVNLKQLNGLFVVIICLHLSSFVVFLLELLSIRFKGLNKLF